MIEFIGKSLVAIHRYLLARNCPAPILGPLEGLMSWFYVVAVKK